MVTRPAVHRASATVGELRAFFEDEHVHAALLAEEGALVGIVERADLTSDLADDAPARTVAALDGRTVDPGAGADETLEAMRRTGRRRLAVADDGGRLLGLLCLKANGRGFCSDVDAASRGAGA